MGSAGYDLVGAGCEGVKAELKGICMVRPEDFGKPAKLTREKRWSSRDPPSEGKRERAAESGVKWRTYPNVKV